MKPKKDENVAINDELSSEEKMNKKNEFLEKVKEQIIIANTDDLVNKQVEGAVDANMIKSSKNAGFLLRLWKHTFFEPVYKQIEIKKVREEIMNSGDIYKGRIDDNKASHNATMKAVTDRLISDYDGALIDGEEKKLLDMSDKEAVKAKQDFVTLLDMYATSQISDAAFMNKKDEIIKTLKNQELLKGASSYADNLFEIAQNARLAIAHGAKLEELDYNLDVLQGKAKSSLKTESHFNMVDNTLDKMKRSGLGRYVSPASASLAIGLAYTASVVMGHREIADTIGSLGVLSTTVGISTLLTGLDQSHRIEEDKRINGLKDAEGGVTEKGDKMRKKLDEFGYSIESSKNLSQKLRNLMFEKDKDGNDILKDIKKEDLENILTGIAEIDARRSLSSRKKIDLISYSNIGEVEKESTDLNILLGKAKFGLDSKLENELKGALNGKNLNQALAEKVKVIEDALLGGEKGITRQDKSFGRHKAWRVFKTMGITAAIGFIVGGSIQEIAGHFRDAVQGIGESTVNPDGSHAVMQTPFRRIFDWTIGNPPSHMDLGNAVNFVFDGHNMKFPEGTVPVTNPDGSINLLSSDGKVLISNTIPKFLPSGKIDPTYVEQLRQQGIIVDTAQKTIDSIKKTILNPQEWFKTHPHQSMLVNHDHGAPFLNQDTPDIVDGNEKLTFWGGHNGATPKGDAILNISHMDPNLSYSGDVSVDVPSATANNEVMAIVYLDGAGSASGQGIPVPADTNGNIIFDRTDPIMQQVFTQDANGQMVSHAKVIEIFQKVGPVDANGIQHIRAIGALPGEGLTDISDTIQTKLQTFISSFSPKMPTEMPFFIPVNTRKDLEPAIYGGKKEPINENVAPLTGKKVPEEKNTIVEPVPPVVPIVEKAEKKEEVVNEMSKEEYDNTRDDLNMINRNIIASAGIIALRESDFKSAYGKKRYKNFEKIPPAPGTRGKGIYRSENDLQIIGNELEKILSGAKVISPEELAKREKIKKDFHDDMDMINRKIQTSSGIITLDENDFKSEYGKKRYNDLKKIPSSRIKGWNKTENDLQIIGNEIETLLSDKKSTPKVETIKNTEEQKKVEEVSPVIETVTSQNVPEAPKETKEAPVKYVIDKPIAKPDNNKVYKLEDLCKVGTKFESESGYFEVKSLKDKWLNSFRPKVELIITHKNSDKKETKTYYKKDLERELMTGNIKINSIK